MTTTQWSCEVCGKTGAVNHLNNADVMAVVNLIAADHRDKSPQCTAGVRRLRLGSGPCAMTCPKCGKERPDRPGHPCFWCRDGMPTEPEPVRGPTLEGMLLFGNEVFAQRVATLFHAVSGLHWEIGSQLLTFVAEELTRAGKADALSALAAALYKDPGGPDNLGCKLGQLYVEVNKISPIAAAYLANDIANTYPPLVLAAYLRTVAPDLPPDITA